MDRRRKAVPKYMGSSRDHRLTCGLAARHTFALDPFAPVAQLDRAPAYEAGGCLFESGRARQYRLSQIRSWLSGRVDGGGEGAREARGVGRVGGGSRSPRRGSRWPEPDPTAGPGTGFVATTDQEPA